MSAYARFWSSLTLKRGSELLKPRDLQAQLPRRPLPTERCIDRRYATTGCQPAVQATKDSGHVVTHSCIVLSMRACTRRGDHRRQRLARFFHDQRSPKKAMRRGAPSWAWWGRACRRCRLWLTSLQACWQMTHHTNPHSGAVVCQRWQTERSFRRHLGKGPSPLAA
jgi:hypothetical protein